MELDEAVHGLGAAVGGAGGVEVGQELPAPLLEGSTEAGDLGDRAGGEGVEDLLRDCSSGGMAGLVVGGADLLGTQPGDFDLDVDLAVRPGEVGPGAVRPG